MKQYINVNEDYGNKLRDEIDTSSGNLRGEVDIIVKNKKTGEIEQQHNHNLIVYGGREWIIKKIFGSQLDGVNDTVLNSEICWFGVGNGGGEPGNPLQCGCTHGSDTDLYNPIKMRYDNDANNQVLNTYYASRIMPSGETEYGYYKRITNLCIKEDHANPYQKNGVTRYPNLIVEARLELSSDDCCGQSYLQKDYTKSYADVNEAALFIADRRCADPGKTAKMSSISYDYYNYDPKLNRVYLAEKQKLPTYNTDVNAEYNWNGDNLYPYNYVQYFDVYVKEEVEDELIENCVEIDGTYYRLSKKVNNEPLLFGKYKKGSLGCVGKVSFNSNTHRIIYGFALDDEELTTESIVIPEIYNSEVTSINDLLFVSHGTIQVIVSKDERIIANDDDVIVTNFHYRVGYNTAQKMLRYQQNLFTDGDSVRLFFPIGYTYDMSNNLIEDGAFNNDCVITSTQFIDLTMDFDVLAIQTDPNSYAVRLYIDDSDGSVISKFNESQKIYMTSDIEENENKITEDNAYTIISVYNPWDDQSVIATMERPYIVIEKSGMVNHDYSTNPIHFKCYSEPNDKPYKMFNRVTFSTIRLNQNRECLICWKLYF